MKMIKETKWVTGTGKNGRKYYRFDIYFTTTNGEKTIRKSVFFNSLEVLVCDLEKNFTSTN